MSKPSRTTITSIAMISFVLLAPAALAIVSHSASEVTPGAFQAGNYSFPSGSRIGIGTSSPGYALHIYDSQPAIQFEESDADGKTWNINTWNGTLNFDSTEASPSNRKVSLTQAGNLGIGTDAPQNMLHIMGNDSTGSAFIEFESSANLRGNKIGVVDYDNILIAADDDNAGGSSYISFTIDGSEKFRMTDGNDLLMDSGKIGNNTNEAYGVDMLLFINHESEHFNCVDGGENAGGVFYDRSDGLYICRYGAMYKVADTGNGLSSDIRLKENIVPLTDVLEDIDEITPVYFSFRDEYIGKVGGIDSSPQLGLIAQEVLPVYPEVVVQDDEDGLMELQYEKLTAVNMAAIKEQQKLIEDLKEENQALKELVCLDHPDAEVCR